MLGAIKEISPQDESAQRVLGQARAVSDTQRPSLAGSDTGGLFNLGFRCLDDEIGKGISDLFADQQLEGHLLQSGDFFGGVSVGNTVGKRVTKYYVTESGCQLLIFSQRVRLIY